MAKIPRRFVRDMKRPAQLVSRHSLSGLNHKIDSDKPLLRGKMAVVEDSAYCYGELIAA